MRHRGLWWLAAIASLAALTLSNARAQSVVAISVDVAAGRRPIDPRIYGVNWASSQELTDLNAPLHRWGGNTTTRYNWQLNADNKGFDWYFQSIASGTATPAGAMDSFVADSLAAGAQPMLTIPTIGWVATLGPNRSKLSSYSIAKYGAQQDADWQWFPDAGNGILPDGTRITWNDPEDASVPVDSTFQQGLVQHMVAQWGPAQSGGVRYYILDNEPSIWFETHRDVHPDGPGMEEIRDRILDYAAKIRAADPGARIVGPEEWGWSGYLFSGMDLQRFGEGQPLVDRPAHGDWDYLPWVLDQLRQHYDATGERPLDVVTVHYYPQSGEFGGGTGAALQALRNRSTRSLWDPGYVDESWINDTVRLIPRLREWVETHYIPGTPIGITEYSWGADDHINGATAQADILGIFGREGLDLATRWVSPSSGSPTFKVHQLYRNYDGNASSFGDVSVAAGGPDPDETSVFAAERSADGALTLMVVNKVAAITNASIDIASFAPAGTAEVYQLTAANSIQRLPDQTLAGNTLSASLPGQSVTLFVLPAAAAPELRVGDVFLTEGTGTTPSASFAVTLSEPSAASVSVDYATTDGTALAGSDYQTTSGTLVIPAGDTSASVDVPVVADATPETDETFTLELLAPVNAALIDATGQATILDDDTVFPAVSIADVTMPEGDWQPRVALFTVSLAEPAAQTVSVTYTTADGTATAGEDYVATSGSLSFDPGTTTQVLSVDLLPDLGEESDEQFTVLLSDPVGAVITGGVGQAAIIDDDLPQIDLCAGLVQDKGPHPMTALAQPALGQTVVDPEFGTTIRRITEVPNVGNNPAIKTMYSTIQAWNADESYLVLYHVGNGHRLYDGQTYAFIRSLNINPNDLEQVYWDTEDPDLLYYVDFQTLIRYHVSTDTREPLRTFSFCSGEASAGDDPMFSSWSPPRIGLGCGSERFIYDIATDTITGQVSSGMPDVPQMAPSGQLAFVGGDVYDAQLNYLRTLPLASPYSHASLGRMANGNDTHNATSHSGSFVGALLVADMTDATRRVVVGEDTGWPYPPSSIHLSALAHERPGWVTVSIVGDPAGQAVLDNELLLADTNTDTVCRIAHHRSWGKNNTNLSTPYWAEPHPVISPSGTRIVFGSDWGDGQTVDTYVIELPSFGPSSTVFTDGFESGGTGAWSTTVP